MKFGRRLPLILGLVLAVGTGVLMLNYLSSMRAPASAAVPMRTVYVAARDIPARALLTDAFFTATPRAASDVDPDAVVNRKDVMGKYSLITIPAGTVLTKAKISDAASGALPARLPLGMRAVSISIDKVKGVAGLIQPGDRVDVIAVPPRISSEVPHASAILRGALVLAMGNEVETTSATPSPDNQNLTTVTLALTPQQVNLLAAADLNTTLRLALRPPKEAIRAFPAEPLVLGMPAQHAERSQPAAAAPQPAAPATPAVVAATQKRERPAPRDGITVIDGDRVTGSGTSGP